MAPDFRQDDALPGRHLEPLRHDIPFGRALAAGRGLGVLDGGEAALELGDQIGVGAAGEDLGDEGAAGGEDIGGEIERRLDQAHGAQMIGLRVADRVGGHVGQDQIGGAAERLLEARRRFVVHEVHLQYGRRPRSDRWAADRCRPATACGRRWRTTCAQPPGAMPRSTTRFAPLRKPKRSSSSTNL